MEEEVKRPFRLWNPKANKFLRSCNYKHMKNAHMGALKQAAWSQVGTTIEVLDVRNGKLLGQWSRTPTSVKFLNIEGGLENV